MTERKPPSVHVSIELAHGRQSPEFDLSDTECEDVTFLVSRLRSSPERPVRRKDLGYPGIVVASGLTIAGQPVKLRIFGTTIWAVSESGVVRTLRDEDGVLESRLVAMARRHLDEAALPREWRTPGYDES